MGAWIEMPTPGGGANNLSVAPFMGAWIEIWGFPRRLPLGIVAPFMGAWIEIKACASYFLRIRCRTLHGCVD